MRCHNVVDPERETNSTCYLKLTWLKREERKRRKRRRERAEVGER